MEAVSVQSGGAGMSATFNPEMTNPMEAVLPALPAEAAPVELASPATADFISQYASYADVFEMPRAVHEWVAVQLVASALNGKVQIEWGAIQYPLDLWILLLSGSGQGRNTTADVALKVIEAANIKGLLHRATWGSKPAVYQQISEHPNGLYVWPELSVVLNTLNQPNFAGVKEWITDRYDNLRVPDAIVYRQTRKKGKDTPPITFDQAPRLNILATSSADWFLNNVQHADAMGGFIPRWLPNKVGKVDRLIPKPNAPDAELLPALGEHLASIAKLDGYSDLSEIEAAYEKWYAEAHARFEKQPNPDLAAPFFNRLRGELLKLATVYEVSQSGSLIITESAFDRAVTAASDAEKTIFELLPTGMSREGGEVGKMERRILDAGPDGISRSDLTIAFQYWDRRVRESRLQTLQDSERIHSESQPTQGRPSMIYVHDKHWTEHEARRK
jgi:hypothetical protein